MLKHSVKLSRYLLCGCVGAYHGMACVFHDVLSRILHSIKSTCDRFLLPGLWAEMPAEIEKRISVSLKLTQVYVTNSRHKILHATG